jgi:hypothetical protein
MGHGPVGMLLVIKHNMSNNAVDTKSYTKQGEERKEDNGGQTVKEDLSQTATSHTLERPRTSVRGFQKSEGR